MMPRYYINDLGGAAKVATLVALAPSNYGTTLDGLTALGRQLGIIIPINSALSTVCAARVQQEGGVAFLDALNTSPTVPGVNYTVIESRDHEVVTPYTNAFLLTAPNVTNITVNRQCVLDSSDHLEIAADPVAMAICSTPSTRPSQSGCRAWSCSRHRPGRSCAFVLNSTGRRSLGKRWPWAKRHGPHGPSRLNR